MKGNHRTGLGALGRSKSTSSLLLDYLPYLSSILYLQGQEMGCTCGKEPLVYQFRFVNFYLNLPLMLLGIIFAVFVYWIYTYCHRNKRLYNQSKLTMPPTSAYPMPPASVFPPRPQPWAKQNVCRKHWNWNHYPKLCINLNMTALIYHIFFMYNFIHSILKCLTRQEG